VSLNYTLCDHCPLDANGRDRLSVNKAAAQKFGDKRSDIKRPSEGEVKE